MLVHQGIVTPQRKLTFRVSLPGGQDRLRQLILYVSEKCLTARFFGAVKLNKILWRADFSAFAARGTPVTGREYQRQQFGPVPKEMLPLHREMRMKGLITVQVRVFQDQTEEHRTIEEHRTVALVPASLDRFSPEDLAFVDRSIAYYWDQTGTEASDDSHGTAWKTRTDGDPMPYELVYLSDDPLPNSQLAKLSERIENEGIFSF